MQDEVKNHELKVEEISNDDFYTFVPKKDIERYKNLIEEDKRFKFVLFEKSYYEYEVNSYKENLNEGYYAGMSQEDEMDRQTEKEFYEKNGNKLKIAEEKLKFYNKELDKYINKEEKKMQDQVKNEKMEFVTIEISRSQVLPQRFPSEKTGKTYRRVMAPGNATFIYPEESLKVDKNNENKLSFVRPKGTEISLEYSVKKDNVSADAPKEEQYENYSKIVTIEDLKEMYELAKQEFKLQKEAEYQENAEKFVNITISDKLVRYFEGKDDHEGKTFAEISVPIEENNKTEYYKFVIDAERVKDSTKEPGKKYFGLFKNNKDDQPNEIIMKKSVKDGEEWIHVEKKVTAVEISELIKESTENYNAKRAEAEEKFVNITVSEKLVKYFEGKGENEGKKYAEISVPIVENGDTQFYKFVIAADYVKDSTKQPGKKYFGLFRNDSDGQPNQITLTKSIKEGDEWKQVEKQLSSEQIAELYDKSRKNYMEQKNSKTLADEKHDNDQKEQGKPKTENVPNEKPIAPMPRKNAR